MKFVIIKKTYKDSNRKSGPFKVINGLFPNNYPMVISEKEYETYAEAHLDNRGESVFDLCVYTGLMKLHRLNFEDAIRARKLKQKQLDRKITHSKKFSFGLKKEDRLLRKELRLSIKKAKKTHELYSRSNKGM